MDEFKIAVIGAGVIGLACAYELSRFSSDIVVLERNDSFGQETSSRNSEVIHAGLYYQPGSLKANTCIRGNRLLYELCAKHNIGHAKLGKLVIACDKAEELRIKEIYDNAVMSGAEGLRFVGKQEIKTMEPDIKAESAFYSPQTGIIDSHKLMGFFLRAARDRGVTFSFATRVEEIIHDRSGYQITVSEPSGERFSFSAQVLINAAGIYSDKVAAMAGLDIDKYGYRLHYCKGEYFRIASPGKFSIKRLIYPPATSISLGIHITPDLGKGLRLGPDAHYVDSIDYSVDPNARQEFFDSVRKFLPALELSDLVPDTAGVRPKIQREKEGFTDFVISHEADKGLPGFINMVGIESPGLTACLAIGEMVREEAKKIII